MQLKHIKTLLPAQDGAAKICAMTWSINGKKLAVCTYDRVVFLFDEFGEVKDKFSTRPCDPKYGKKSYLVKCLAFSPDAGKIAVGQSDDILFVYKIGDDWGEKKTICNKFIYNGAVTCMAWLPDNQLVYGTSEGKVRLANTRSNKSSTLYEARSYAMTIAASPSGKGILSGHADGSIVKYMVSEDDSGESSGKLCVHPCAPYALAWGTNSILAAGCDKRVFAYSKDGRIMQQFDYNRDKEMEEKEFTCAVCSPSGQSVVVGSFDRLRIYNWSPRKGLWDEGPPKEIKNLYTITALAWKPDGSKLFAGSLCGAVEVFDCCLKKSIYKNKFEISHVGISQVMVKSLVGKQSLSLKSRKGNEITEVKVIGGDRYVLAHTASTLILADMNKKSVCEVPWSATGGNEKYSFDNENVCIVFNAGELTLIEYGKNEILGSVRTEFTNKHLLSIRINERKKNNNKPNKKMAYLVDLKTISILDLVSGIAIGTVNHDFKIGWLELNETGRKLLFRDQKLKLHLYDVDSQSKTTILNYCYYVQWVPGSDVVVAQNRDDLCIWYNIETPEKVSTLPIKGDVVDIERHGGKTEVVVSDGSTTTKHLLDEGLIEFRTAVDDGDYARAVAYLESLGMSPETEALWQRLSGLSLENNELLIAERCYAALGDVARARNLNEMNNLVKEVDPTMTGEGFNHYKVQAKMAIMEKNFKLAENIYLDQNNVDEAIKMYQDLHKWEDAIMVAEAKYHPETETLKKKYYLWLMESGQEGKAGELKERAGDYETAVQLYIKAGLPAKAARLISSRNELMSNPDLVQRVTSALVKAEMYEKAGDLSEKLSSNEKAIEFYRKGNCYQKAVELARSCSPHDVVKLEEEWGNYLVHQKKYDPAINHFIEAGATVKAVEAAINSRQWAKATQILEVISERPDVKKYYVRIAQHFLQVADYQQAERYFVAADCINEAIEMHSNAGRWDLAHKLASKYMDPEKVNAMSLNRARNLEEKKKFRDAEKLYVTIDKADEAISMYKKQKMYEDMLRMVKQYRPNHVKDTHLYLAKLLEAEGKLRLAEHHLVEARDVEGAIRLYTKGGRWEEAYRVAGAQGGPSHQQRVSYEWARSLGGESAIKLLNKLGMLESTLDLALKTSPPDFEFAYELARDKDKMSYVSERKAEYLEENGRLKEAEAEFIKAGIPKNAVLMYVSCKDWDSAQRVAELYDKSSVGDVMTAQGHVAFENGEFQKAESFFLRAQRPTIIVQRYKESNMWADALRVCKEYLPNLLPELQSEFDSKTSSDPGSSNIQSMIERAQEFEAAGEYARAVKCYVDVTSQSSDDVIIVEKCYKKATQLALKFLSQENVMRVVEVVGPRLVEMKRYNGAAELYLQADMIKEAITAFISGEEWTKAKSVAAEMEPKLLPYVEKKYKTHLKEKDSLDVLENVDIEAALKGYVAKGEWNKALTIAENKSPELLPKYVAEYATRLVLEKKITSAIEVFVRYGSPALPQNFNLYKRIFHDAVNTPDTRDVGSFKMWSTLRDLLYDLNKNLNQSKIPDTEALDFRSMLLVAHYYATRSAMQGHDSLSQSACKLSVSLLRHIDLIPADKAFYEAGFMCRESDQEEFALILYNRFLDISEAIEDPSLVDATDHPLLSETDIPSDFPLPESPHISASELEEVKEWVLAMSMDQKLSADDYPKNSKGFYVGSLVNRDSTEKFPPCILTGYPVLEREITFKRQGAFAIKEDWNKFVTAIKTTRSPELCNVFEFIGEWCGIPQQHTTGFSVD